MNKYLAYGLVFESALDLSPLKPLVEDRPADVSVRLHRAIEVTTLIVNFGAQIKYSRDFVAI